MYALCQLINTDTPYQLWVVVFVVCIHSGKKTKLTIAKLAIFFSIIELVIIVKCHMYSLSMKHSIIDHINEIVNYLYKQNNKKIIFSFYFIELFTLSLSISIYLLPSIVLRYIDKQSNYSRWQDGQILIIFDYIALNSMPPWCTDLCSVLTRLNLSYQMK